VTEQRDEGDRRGTVEEFDEAEGLGTITTDDRRRFPFHCIEIADGTRTIETGTEVRFRVIGKLGRWEAADIRT
jgi:CspA family cold shock protein